MNFTTGASQQLETFLIGVDDENVAFVGLTFPALFFNTGDVLAYVIDPSPAQFEIDLAFSIFTPGTYNGFVAPRDLNLNMEIIPEPTTSLLSVLGATMLLRRRRA